MNTLFKALMTLIPVVGIFVILFFGAPQEIDVDDWEQVGTIAGWVLYHALTAASFTIYLM